MWTFIWHTFFFDPVYNTLVFFIDTIPHGDVGVAIIATVIVIKLVILPLSIKVAKMQTVMREIEPKMKEIKETITDREAQAKAMMELYRRQHQPLCQYFFDVLAVSYRHCALLGGYSWRWRRTTCY